MRKPSAGSQGDLGGCFGSRLHMKAAAAMAAAEVGSGRGAQRLRMLRDEGRAHVALPKIRLAQRSAPARMRW